MMFNNLFFLRFILSLFVVFFHLNGNMKAYGTGGFDFQIFGNGTTAVFAFFVISGFLMHSTQLIHDKRVFYLKRAKRILPLYYLVLFIGIIFYLVGYFFKIDVLNSPLYALFFPLLLLPQIIYLKYRMFLGFIEILWSIGVEIIYYLIFPVVKNMQLPVLIIAITLISVFQNYFHPVYSNYLNYFLLGHVLSILHQKITVKTGTLGLILFCLGIIRFFILPEKITEINFYNCILNLLSAGALVFGGIRTTYNLDKLYFIKMMGEASYALYLSHFFAILPIIYLGSIKNWSGGLIFFLGVSTAILTGFIFNWIDRNLQRYMLALRDIIA